MISPRWIPLPALLACAPTAPLVRELPPPAVTITDAAPLQPAAPPEECAAGAPAAPGWRKAGPRWARGVVILPGGPVLAYGSASLRVYDRRSGEVLEEAEVCAGPRALRPLDRHRTWVVCEQEIHEVTIPGMQNRTLCRHPTRADEVTFSASAVAFGSVFGGVEVRRVGTWTQAAALRPRATFLRSIALSGDGGALALVGDDGLVEVVDLASGERRTFTVPRSRQLRVLGFSALGGAVWYADNQRVRGALWRSGEEIAGPPPELPAPADRFGAADGPLRCSLLGRDHEELACDLRCPAGGSP